jgi:DMSO/TMAO reductase YedYZ molybdopterin-dependent catalytic subunit
VGNQLNMDNKTPDIPLTSMRMSVFFGFLTSLGFMAISFTGMKLFGLYFVPFDIFDWLARILPGRLVTAGIDTLILTIRTLNLSDISQSAKLAENALAVLIFIFVGGALGGMINLIARRRNSNHSKIGTALGLTLALLTAIIEASLGFLGSISGILWLGVIFSIWGWVLGWLIQTSQEMESYPASLSRRTFVSLVGGGVFAMSVIAFGLAKLIETGGEEVDFVPPDLFTLDDTSGIAASPAASVLQNRIEPALGTRSELTATRDFYNVDINSAPRRIDETNWTLEIGGLVRNPLSLTLADIRQRPSVTQAITLQCISNPIGGDLTGTSKWRGVQLGGLLEEAELHPEVEEMFIEADDGFYESVGMADIMDPRTLLVYEMNDEPLPIEHGFPLRIYIPNRYGMKQPKWIVRMTAIDSEGNGYWVDRGWSEEARPVTVSVIDTVAASRDMQDGDNVAIGGIAYAGSRQISKVEVQVDDGDWIEAQLRTPPLSPLTWVQWRYDWPYVSGRHTFYVRAHDGEGVLQPTSQRSVRPNGATGTHSLTIRV